MNKLIAKIKGWFKPQLTKPKKTNPSPAITKIMAGIKTQPTQPSPPAYQSPNHYHYRKLIGKLTKQAIAIQRTRQRRNC